MKDRFSRREILFLVPSALAASALTAVVLHRNENSSLMDKAITDTYTMEYPKNWYFLPKVSDKYGASYDIFTPYPNNELQYFNLKVYARQKPEGFDLEEAVEEYVGGTRYQVGTSDSEAQVDVMLKPQDEDRNSLNRVGPYDAYVIRTKTKFYERNTLIFKPESSVKIGNPVWYMELTTNGINLENGMNALRKMKDTFQPTV